MLKNSWLVLAGLVLVSGQVLAEDATTLKTDKDRLSYSIGASIGKNFKREGTEVDPNLLFKGLKSALAGEHLLLTEKEWHSVLNSYQTEMLQHAKLSKHDR